MSTLLDPTHCNMVRLDIPENLRGECIVVGFFIIISLWMTIQVEQVLRSHVEFKCAFVSCANEPWKDERWITGGENVDTWCTFSAVCVILCFTRSVDSFTSGLFKIFTASASGGDSPRKKIPPWSL